MDLDLDLAPDIEALVVDFLLADADVAAAVNDSVHTELPPAPNWPVLRVTRVGGPTTYPGWLDHPRVQVESFADTKASAYDVIAVARAVLLQRLVGVHGAAVVTSVDEDSGLIWLPDRLQDPTGTGGVPPRPRYLFTVGMTVHPAS